MNITYTQNGDYLIPNIVIRKTKPLGHYGRLRKAYLEMHRPILFNELVLSDKLFEHCAEIDETARNRMELIVRSLVLCQEKVQIKSNQFSLCLAKLNLLFLSHYLLDFSDILPHIGLGINTRNGCEYVLYCKMFLCIQKSTYMHVYN